MAQPPPGRGAAAEAEGGGGGNREPPGAGAGGGGEGGGGGGGGRAPPGSAAWNGSCGLRPAATTTEDDGNDDGDGDGSSTGGCCRCRARDGSCGLACPRCAATEQRPPPPAPREAEEGEEDATGEDPGGAGKGSRRPRRRQRPRSAPKEKEKEEGGRRQRPARKRSRGARTEELARLKALLEAALGQARRLCAEAGGRLLCSCCHLGAVELGSAPGTVRSWGRRVGQRARSGWLRAARGLRAGAEVARRLLWMLCALLLLLLVLLLGCLRLCWRAVAAGVARLGRTRLAAFLDATGLRRTWGLLGAAGTCQRLRDWLRRWRAPPGELRTGCGPGDAAPGLDPGAPAASSGEEVARLLAMADVPEEELNPFQALGVEATASDAELKKAYRRLAVLVHPDKNEHPRAEEAFKVLRAAWDIVSNPERRKEYEMKRMAESELSRSVNEFLSRLQDDLKEAMNTMMCSKCQGKHKRFELDRDPLSARYCAECGQLHPAEEGDFWAESSLLGLKITYLAVMDGKVYDITEWAGCQRVGICPDTHRVPYHISFGARSAGAGGRQRSASKGSPSSAADLQDFFTRVFQGTSGPMPGGFPSPPPPAAPPGAAAAAGAPPRTEGGAPKGDAKHKRRKKVRRPFQR